MFAAVTTYEHIQSFASDVWTVNHNLGIKAPIVDAWLVVNAETIKVLPDMVEFVDINNCNIHFTSPGTGTAIIA